MTIINPEILKNYYKCNRAIMEYLLYDCLIPIMGYLNNEYYFDKTEELEQCLKKMPLDLKIIALFTKHV